MLKTMKKALSLVLVLTMLMSMACISGLSASAATGDQLILGDVNRDGQIDVRDATAVQRFIVHSETFDDVQEYLADVDGRVGIDVRDATQIQRYIVHSADPSLKNADGYAVGDIVDPDVIGGGSTKPTETKPSTGTVTFKFTNNQGWDKIYVHSWNSDGDLTKWPGTLMTESETNGYGEEVYTITIPANAKGCV
ncbi:MAG: starch-binding protein, partial [Ruminococcus sp.]|nr:starch-binding protein [Ruminococcus sp.]